MWCYNLKRRVRTPPYGGYNLRYIGDWEEGRHRQATRADRQGRAHLTPIDKRIFNDVSWPHTLGDVSLQSLYETKRRKGLNFGSSQKELENATQWPNILRLSREKGRGRGMPLSVL